MPHLLLTGEQSNQIKATSTLLYQFQQNRLTPKTQNYASEYMDG